MGSWPEEGPLQALASKELPHPTRDETPKPSPPKCNDRCTKLTIRHIRMIKMNKNTRNWDITQMSPSKKPIWFGQRTKMGLTMSTFEQKQINAGQGTKKEVPSCKKQHDHQRHNSCEPLHQVASHPYWNQQIAYHYEECQDHHPMLPNIKAK